MTEQMEDSPRKKVNTNNEDSDEKEQSDDSHLRPERCLTYPTVLSIIFKYLDIFDLERASKVCKSWLEAARNEKRVRRSPVCRQIPLTKIEKSLWFKSYEEPKPPSAHGKLPHPACKDQIIEDLKIVPSLGLFFTSNHGVSSMKWEETEGSDTSYKCHCMRLSIPNYRGVVLCGQGMILNEEEINKKSDSLVYAFLPEDPNLLIRQFFFRARGPGESWGNWSGFFKRKLNMVKNFFARNSDETPKCLMVFADAESRNMAKEIADSISYRYRDNLAIWGGIAEKIYICNSKIVQPRWKASDPFHYVVPCLAIALVGKIDAWSIIIDKECNTKELVQEKLKSFKEQVVLRKHSIGFLFACCARGKNMFKAPNVESSIFRTLFPDVPLVGCFGEGEFGWNTVVEKWYDRNGTYQEFSSVFAILTYG